MKILKRIKTEWSKYKEKTNNWPKEAFIYLLIVNLIGGLLLFPFLWMVNGSLESNWNLISLSFCLAGILNLLNSAILIHFQKKIRQKP